MRPMTVSGQFAHRNINIFEMDTLHVRILQPCAYKDNKEIYVAIRDWGEKGKLNDLQQKLLLSPRRAKEELYDLKNDPGN